MLALLFPALALLLAAPRSYAQETLFGEELTPVQQGMVQTLGGTTVDYWTPRLNGYKRTIDQAMSPTDLATLNNLRVRWGVLLSKFSEKLHTVTEHGDPAYHEDDEESEDAISDVPDATDPDGYDFDDEGEFGEFEFESDDEEGFSEVMDIWMQTTMLASTYRINLDRLSTDVIEDIGGFTVRVADVMDEYTAEHRAELEGDEKGAELLAEYPGKRDDLRNAGAKLSESEDFKSVYGFAVEPLIMLYNGGDLRDLLPFGLGQVSSVDVDANSLADLLPAGGVLTQNYPNPASSRTTVDFTLPAASSTTTLRLFAADGKIVRTVDLGSLPAGPQSATLDVADLPAGTYLYHLTIATAEGEQVFSKAMQVVR